MRRWLPRCGWLGHDGLSGDLNGLTRPTVPSAAIQERMLAKPEERRDVVGQNCPGPVRPARLGFIPHERDKRLLGDENI
ncbi:hypothetical protein [Actinomyces oris]|uniref:hypothetical protein n=1 Tax=Actinomyces oris TaxID=544580 RepID=UPI0028D77977|nr:hypothetical protein [Actinomyces oris]